MQIACGADHGGVDLKDQLVAYLKEEGYQVLDLGTHGHESVDYPQYGQAVAEKVAKKEADFGLCVCGSGIGISIAANKVKGVRCVRAHDPYSAEMSRRHNNCNVIAMGGRFVGLDMAKKCLKVFLETEFEGGRHQRRVGQLEREEKDRGECYE